MAYVKLNCGRCGEEKSHKQEFISSRCGPRETFICVDCGQQRGIIDEKIKRIIVEDINGRHITGGPLEPPVTVEEVRKECENKKLRLMSISIDSVGCALIRVMPG